MTLPLPWQSGQTLSDCMTMPMKFCCVRTVPVPWQRRQVSAELPAAAPVPWHWSQFSMREAPTSFSVPKTASSKVRSTETLMSSPRIGAFGLLRLDERPPPPPKKLPKRSPRSPKSPKPPKPPPNGLPPPAPALKLGSTPAKPN